MSKKILFVTATPAEAVILTKIKGVIPVRGGYRYGKFEITLLITGVGSMSTAWAMKRWITENEKPDLAVNLGIAGSYKDEFENGEVVMPVSDCFADSGIEDGDNFLTLSEAGLVSDNEFPFRNGLIISNYIHLEKMKNLLKPVRAITVNTATGSDATREKLMKKFNPDIETMEGATFFYICSVENISFLALRSISNRVEARNKSKWDISLALNNLSKKLEEIILTL